MINIASIRTFLRIKAEGRARRLVRKEQEKEKTARQREKDQQKWNAILAEALIFKEIAHNIRPRRKEKAKGDSSHQEVRVAKAKAKAKVAEHRCRLINNSANIGTRAHASTVISANTVTRQRTAAIGLVKQVATKLIAISGTCQLRKAQP